MTRKRLTKEQIKERERLIREYVQAGYSANRIQKTLSQKGLGMSRKKLLDVVRQIKGKTKKPYTYRYVPRKYRKYYVPEKWIAVYGTVKGKSRRIEMKGTGRELYRAMKNVMVYPPRRRFVKCHAIMAKNYLDFGKSWDRRPDIDYRER